MDIIIKNNKARYEYEFIEKYLAGIKLVGGEVKSVRDHKVSISEAYCYISNGEIFIKGMHVSEYERVNKYDSYEPTRIRKLLLNKKEILKLESDLNKKGLTIVPLSVVIKNGFIKLEIALCRGKNVRDKREDIKKRDIERELNIKF
jgi:SsrA-binding protein